LSLSGVAGTTAETIDIVDLDPGHSLVTITAPNGSAMTTTSP
jgi:hypothetical protein